MNDTPDLVGKTGMTSEELVLRYEELRSQVLSESGGFNRGRGLTLLMRQGLLAWMKAWFQCRPRVEEPPRYSAQTEAVIALDLRAHLALVLAGMALGQYQEEER